MKFKYYILLLSIFIITGCKKTFVNKTDLITPDWTEETHGDGIAPTYGVVFEEGKVLRLDVVIAATKWSEMQSDLSKNINMGSQVTPTDNEWVPVWVPCSLKFNGKEWYKVGIRYKGNSSLKECVRRGVKKYSFKLDFDQFEDNYPEIKNQRFYGFKQLNLSNGFDDMTLMREKTSDDLFREFGISSARASFCQVWIDFGMGAKYFGLYTLIEEVDNTVIETQFMGGGNLYKPEGTAATFANGSYNISQFYRKTNLETSDYSDVRAFYDALNSPLRTSDPTAWKTKLEIAFNVPHFLKWLAANTVIQNWDTYGKMSHNYYLYNDPATGKLTWIPWDNNESLRPGKQGGALSLSFTEVTSGWPLIRYIINDNSYTLIYKNYLASFIQNPFSVTSFQDRIDRQTLLIRQYAISEIQGFTFLSSPSVFDPAIIEIKQHVQNRNTAVKSYLGLQ
jgi:spore coat protein H